MVFTVMSCSIFQPESAEYANAEVWPFPILSPNCSCHCGAWSVDWNLLELYSILLILNVHVTRFWCWSKSWAQIQSAECGYSGDFTILMSLCDLDSEWILMNHNVSPGHPAEQGQERVPILWKFHTHCYSCEWLFPGYEWRCIWEGWWIMVLRDWKVWKLPHFHFSLQNGEVIRGPASKTLPSKPNAPPHITIKPRPQQQKQPATIPPAAPAARIIREAPDPKPPVIQGYASSPDHPSTFPRAPASTLNLKERMSQPPMLRPPGTMNFNPLTYSQQPLPSDNDMSRPPFLRMGERPQRFSVNMPSASSDPLLPGLADPSFPPPPPHLRMNFNNQPALQRSIQDLLQNVQQQQHKPRPQQQHPLAKFNLGPNDYQFPTLPTPGGQPFSDSQRFDPQQRSSPPRSPHLTPGVGPRFKQQPHFGGFPQANPQMLADKGPPPPLLNHLFQIGDHSGMQLPSEGIDSGAATSRDSRTFGPQVVVLIIKLHQMNESSVYSAFSVGLLEKLSFWCYFLCYYYCLF